MDILRALSLRIQAYYMHHSLPNGVTVSVECLKVEGAFCLLALEPVNTMAPPVLDFLK
jgi:hypothetical protein